MVSFLLPSSHYNSYLTVKNSVMKTKLVFTLVLTVLISGCQKQQADDIPDNSSVTTQFEKSDTIIGGYLDKLDSPETPQAEQIQILCTDYSAEYKAHYMPALLKLSPQEYTEAKLLKDLDIALAYYKEKLGINCDSN